MGYCPRGHKELNTTEQLTLSLASNFKGLVDAARNGLSSEQCLPLPISSSSQIRHSSGIHIAGRFFPIFPSGSDSKESTCNVGDPGLIPDLGRYLEGGNGNPFQYSCLGNSMNRGVWWVTVHGLQLQRVRHNRLTLFLSGILLITNLVFFSEFSASLLFRGQPHETVLDLDH